MRPIDWACYLLRDLGATFSDEGAAGTLTHYPGAGTVTLIDVLGQIAALKILADAHGWSSISGAASLGPSSLFILRRFIEDMGGRVRD